MWFNPHLNRRQRAAVAAAAAGAYAPSPYLIFGPPGTGKTATVVEAAVQVRVARCSSPVTMLTVSTDQTLSTVASSQILRDPFARVLLLAPSNTAADELALRLMGPGAGQPRSSLLRVNAYQRAQGDVPRWAVHSFRLFVQRVHQHLCYARAVCHSHKRQQRPTKCAPAGTSWRSASGWRGPQRPPATSSCRSPARS